MHKQQADTYLQDNNHCTGRLYLCSLCDWILYGFSKSLDLGLGRLGTQLLRLQALLLLEQGIALGHLVVEVAQLRLRVEGQVLAAVVEPWMPVDADEVLLAGLRMAIVAQLPLRTDVHLGCGSIERIGGGAIEAQIGLGIAVGH